ncbi:MAG TPA: ThuA domain-containing protein [Rhizomicrobium sp.]|nr:ThuA domain-containing protein [Rhizomicrobium sp.]
MPLRRFAVTALVFGLATLAAGAQTGNPGGPINDYLGDMDYGVCRGTDPKCFHDWPRVPAKQFRILLFTRTNGGYRHANLGPPLARGLNPPLTPQNVVHQEMLRIAAENGWHLDYTEDVSAMNKIAGLTPDPGASGENLDSYNAIIFFSTSREVLDDAAKNALRHYMEGGGGFVAIHSALASLYGWTYYQGLLGNASFYSHDPVREGEVVTVNGTDVSTRDLPKRWHFQDEWYNLVPFPTHVRFLATVDEKSWPARPPENRNTTNPSVIGRMPGHGSFHPVAWCQYFDGGKAWVTSMGHDARIFANDDKTYDGSVAFRKMIVGGIKSVMGAEPFCR